MPNAFVHLLSHLQQIKSLYLRKGQSSSPSHFSYKSDSCYMSICCIVLEFHHIAVANEEEEEDHIEEEEDHIAASFFTQGSIHPFLLGLLL